jgi:hypothetical protein
MFSGPKPKSESANAIFSAVHFSWIVGVQKRFDVGRSTSG